MNDIIMEEVLLVLEIKHGGTLKASLWKRLASRFITEYLLGENPYSNCGYQISSCFALEANGS